MDAVWKFAIVILVMAILVISCFCVLLRIRRMYKEHDRKRKIMRRNSEKYKRNKKLRRKKSLERAKTEGLYGGDKKRKEREWARYHGVNGIEDNVDVGDEDLDEREREMSGGFMPMRVQTESSIVPPMSMGMGMSSSPRTRQGNFKVRRVMSGKGARSRSPPRGMFAHPGQRGGWMDMATARAECRVRL